MVFDSWQTCWLLVLPAEKGCLWPGILENSESHLKLELEPCQQGLFAEWRIMLKCWLLTQNCLLSCLAQFQPLMLPVLKEHIFNKWRNDIKLGTNNALCVWGIVASWLVCLTPEQALGAWALAGNTVLCSWARHLTLKVPLSILVTLSGLMQTKVDTNYFQQSTNYTIKTFYRI